MAVTLEDLVGALLAVLEGGEKLAAFQDSGGVWTIGLGHTGPEVKRGLTITHAQSLAYLAADDAGLFKAVSGRPILEAAALIDFGYNCGRGALARVLAGADSISNPVHTTDRTGQVRTGLVSRRRLEMVLMELSRDLAGNGGASTLDGLR